MDLDLTTVLTPALSALVGGAIPAVLARSQRGAEANEAKAGRRRDRIAEWRSSIQHERFLWVRGETTVPFHQTHAWASLQSHLPVSLRDRARDAVGTEVPWDDLLTQVDSLEKKWDLV